MSEPRNLIELKAKMLCEGVNATPLVEKLFLRQNPSNVKRGGLSSGGKMQLSDCLVVNAPFYQERMVDLKVAPYSTHPRGIIIRLNGKEFCTGKVLPAPAWYRNKVGEFNITQIVTVHNCQLAIAVYEDCILFKKGSQCQFCVMNCSLQTKSPKLVKKSNKLIIDALKQIPVERYGGLTLNGGMTLSSGRGMELIRSVITAVRKTYPALPIAVEITPPQELDWIDSLVEAGMSSLMMNLECWDKSIRAKLIPGKNKYCPRGMYLKAFEYALRKLGPGRVTTCFVVGTEPIKSLKRGIEAVIKLGVIPSPLAGRFFEDIPDYPFTPKVDWQEFLEVLYFARRVMKKEGLVSTDQAGCVVCGMCDLIGDM